MKKGFSLLELIFAIVVIGVIASFAVPKFLDTKDSAVISTLKRDISTIVSSVQSYHIQKGEILAISDAIVYNEQNWNIVDDNKNKITDSNECLSIEVKENVLYLTLDETNTENICKKIQEDKSISNQEYQLL